MTDEPLLVSVRGDARRLVEPDAVDLSMVLVRTRPTKADALQAAAQVLAAVTDDLRALAGVPLRAASGRAPLTWSAQSATTRPEGRHDGRTGQWVETGAVTATVLLVVGVRAFGQLDPLGDVLAGHDGLDVQQVAWMVDHDNPAWPQVRAEAISAAVRKARDYAAALGATVRSVEHLADVGLLGGGGMSLQGEFMTQSMRAPGGDTPSLDPVPQELVAAVEARVRTDGQVLPQT